MEIRLLDCTLRDGGYYTNWDFNKSLVKTYMEAMEVLPIEYVEVGYRSKQMKNYLGEYFYLPEYVLEELNGMTTKKLVIILNEKDIRQEDLDEVLSPCVGIISMVRIAIDPANFERAIVLAKGVKAMGFEVGFNIMYMSKWKEYPDFLNSLHKVNGLVDFFYMVDSFGGVFPEEVKEVIEIVKERVDVSLGFHGHNNLELALINTLTAIDCGVDIVDSTIMGMGRGAGNLKTELLLTVLNAKGNASFDFNALSKVVDGFTELHEEYRWGANLPYMVSGAHSLPQKEVMDWVGKRYYSLNSIIRALQNQSQGISDNRKLPVFNGLSGFSNALIVGGGPSVKKNAEAIRQFLSRKPETIVIHASSKNAMEFNNIKNTQIFCLVGNEGHRMEDVFSGNLPDEAICISPPYPRKMGTYIPEKLEKMAFELNDVKFSDKYLDSHTALALETCYDLKVSNIWLVGYDGYGSGNLSQREQELFYENEYLFNMAKEHGMDCESLTATSYKNLVSQSVFSYI